MSGRRYLDGLDDFERMIEKLVYSVCEVLQPDFIVATDSRKFREVQGRLCRYPTKFRTVSRYRTLWIHRIRDRPFKLRKKMNICDVIYRVGFK